MLKENKYKFSNLQEKTKPSAVQKIYENKELKLPFKIDDLD